MSNNPDEIRADIERTRHELSRDVDALAEKTNPTKVVERQGDKVRERVTSIKESIMGSPDDSYGHSAGSDNLAGRAKGAAQDVQDRAKGVAQDVQDRAEDAVHSVQQAPQKVRQGTRGNPLAAGLIALGAGWLIGSLIPTSRVEQDAAQKVKEQSAPVIEEAKSAAQEMGENLKPQAQEAAQSVKETATSGAQNVKAEGQQKGQQLKGEAQDSAQNVKGTAQNS